MEWEIKHGFRQDILLNAAHEKTAMIRRIGGSYLITDTLGQTLYRCERETPLVIRVNGTDEGYAKVNLAEANSIFIPPRAEYMEVTFSGAMISIYQTSQRDFLISKGDEQIGKITGILRKSKQLEFLNVFPANTIAILYTLALFMLHADDIDIV